MVNPNIEGELEYVRRPRTAEELAEIVRDAPALSTNGLNPFRVPSEASLALRLDSLRQSSDPGQDRLAKAEADLAAFRNGASPTKIRHVSLERLGGVVEHHIDDQVVVVRGGTSIWTLQSELEKAGQCLPLPALIGPSRTAMLSYRMDVQTAVGFNLPHSLEAQCGSWRDWVLGATVVLADGTLAKTGSQAVKNVAGYDVHKLLIGSRGTLGVVAEVILRTFPLTARPLPEAQTEAGWSLEAFNKAKHLWAQRTRRSDFEAALRTVGDALIESDPASCTLWASVPPDQELARFADDWVLRGGCGEKNLRLDDPTQIRLMKRAKEIFDPGHKMNPGELGIL